MPAGAGTDPAASTAPQPGVREDSPRPRLTPALIVVALVALLAVVAAGVSGGWSLSSRIWFDGLTLSGDRTPQMMSPPPAEPPPLGQASAFQRGVALAMIVALALAVLAGLIYLARWLWKRRPRRAVVVEDKPDATPAGVLAEAHLPTLLRGAEVAERILLETGGVPRDLVLRCWLALEEAAAASGAGRRPSDSPTEFTGTVLRSTAADAASVDTLLHLYQRARFSQHPVSDEDVRAARAAVIKLASSWRGFDTAMRHTARTDP